MLLVHQVTSGYIGGHTQHPSYKEICNGDTGHAEAIKITYDAALIDFETLLEIFFASHDPTTPNRQGNDIGTQYRSAVFCLDDTQKIITENMIKALNAQGAWPNPIVTQVNNAATFYPAEDYHQHYFANNPTQPYCLAVAAPKAAKIRAKYAHLVKSND
ncbi:MAG: peptide-methionine (S)-S-oxide reductase [Betaproteobacteria bacterium HGW-Betaproteobacteria-22]|nr:MAG: peptide-methionine (S)-S-oxide reductase [Betaproteobacteria bacterium HGW-Betaproteobacteria-22]